MRKHTRRRVLGLTAAGVSGAALAGCSMFEEAARSAPTTPPPDALQPLLDEAAALAAAYDRTVTAQPALAARLATLAADHRAHATALARLIGKPPASVTATAVDGLIQLREAEQTGQRNAIMACTAATAERAALVGSIAACRATHVEALR